MPKTSLRAVPDTNILLASEMSPGSTSPNREYFERWKADEFAVLFSEDTLLEYGKKLREKRPGRGQDQDLSRCASCARSRDLHRVLPFAYLSGRLRRHCLSALCGEWPRYTSRDLRPPSPRSGGSLLLQDLQDHRFPWRSSSRLGRATRPSLITRRCRASRRGL